MTLQSYLQSYLGVVARVPQNWLRRRGERSQNVLLGSWMMMVSTLVNTLARVGIVALLARIYAREEFGVWVAITSATAILATSDFGIGNALRNKLAELVVRDEAGTTDEARECFLSVFYFFLIAALVLSAGFAILSQFIPFQILFKTSDMALQSSGANILIAVQIIFIIGIPLGIGPIMFFAYQESTWSAMIGIAYGLITAVLVGGLALAGQSIVITAIWYFLAGLLVNMVGTVVFMRRRRWNPFRVSPRLILPRVWSLLPLSLRFAALQISGAFILNSATIVISATISVGDAAEYNLVQKLYTFALMLYLSVYNPLWAGYADAVHREDWSWCQKTLKRILALTTAVFVGLAIMLTLFGNFFLQVLAGKGYDSHPALFILLGLCTLFHTLWSCVMAFLSAVERINVITILTVICAVLFVPLAEILGQRYGIDGIALSLALVLAPLAILGHGQAFLIVRRALSAS